MLSIYFRKNKDIIKVGGIVVVKDVIYNIVNIVLKYSGCVIEAK